MMRVFATHWRDQVEQTATLMRVLCVRVTELKEQPIVGATSSGMLTLLEREVKHVRSVKLYFIWMKLFKGRL